MTTTPRAHGGDGWRLAAALGVAPEEVLDLSASLNPVAPDPLPTLGRHLGALRRYPDPADAEEHLAKAIGVEPDRVVLTNGGAEAIALVASVHPDGWVDDPDFSLYRRHLRTVTPGARRWRSNPHNPSGLLAPDGEDAAVWDEAFWPLATGTWTRGDADAGRLVIGSLTKLFACPGLRVGYVLCPDSTSAQALRNAQPEWAVNGLAVSALPDLLATVDLPAWSTAVSELRRQLVQILDGAGYEPARSDANWVLVRAPRLRERLAASAICVRDCTSFGLPGIVRIAVPDSAGLERLRRAL